MHWNSWSEFWAMGAYAAYVWGSFGVTALCLALECAWLRHAQRRIRQELEMNAQAQDDEA